MTFGLKRRSRQPSVSRMAPTSNKRSYFLAGEGAAAAEPAQEEEEADAAEALEAETPGAPAELNDAAVVAAVLEDASLT